MTSNRRATRLLWVGLVSAVLFGVACGGGEDERGTATPTPLARPDTRAPAAAPDTSMPESASPAPADSSSGMAGGGSVAEQLRQEVDLPDTFPSDAPVYPETVPSQYVELVGGRLSLTFGTSDPPEDVMEYMVAELPRRRWNIVAQNDLETGQILQATKGDRLFSMLLSRVDEGKPGEITMIAISVDP